MSASRTDHDRTTATMSEATADAYAHCGALVAAADKDRALAALFVAPDHRRHLHALLAFNHEIACVRDLVSDPLPGEVRLQWWRDLLQANDHGEAQSHPVARALLHTVTACRLPVAPLVALTEARTFDLYDDLFPTLADFEGYCGETASSLFRLSCLVLSPGRDPGGAALCGHAGIAYAGAGLLRSLPRLAARGQVFIPRDVLEAQGARHEDLIAGRITPELTAAIRFMADHAASHWHKARGEAGTLAAEAVPALLPLAVVESVLARLRKTASDPFRRNLEVPQWRRQWALWRAARRGLFA